MCFGCWSLILPLPLRRPRGIAWRARLCVCLVCCDGRGLLLMIRMGDWIGKATRPGTFPQQQ